MLPNNLMRKSKEHHREAQKNVQTSNQMFSPVAQNKKRGLGWTIHHAVLHLTFNFVIMFDKQVQCFTPLLTFNMQRWLGCSLSKSQFQVPLLHLYILIVNEGACMSAAAIC